MRPDPFPRSIPIPSMPVPATPLEPAPPELAPGRDLWLKREDRHELGAFKWRGALPTLREYRERGAGTVVSASTGNHGAAAAWAAQRLDMTAIVYAPEATSRTKLGRMQDLGAEVRLVGVDVDEAKDAARAFAAAEGLPFFEDGAEPAQFAGYRTIAEEILEQAARPPAAVIVPVGNGALLVGIGGALGDAAPEVERVGVVAAAAPVMALSHESGEPVPCDEMATFADGLAVRVAIPLAVAELQRAADRMLRVSERDIARAVGAYARVGIRAEGAAGAGLAALEQVEADPVVVIMCGANIDDDLHARAVERPDSFPD
jgi:threonine dehydratase